MSSKSPGFILFYQTAYFIMHCSEVSIGEVTDFKKDGNRVKKRQIDITVLPPLYRALFTHWLKDCQNNLEPTYSL